MINTHMVCLKDDLLVALRDHYPRLSFEPALRKDFLSALIHAAGHTKVMFESERMDKQ